MVRSTAPWGVVSTHRYYKRSQRTGRASWCRKKSCSVDTGRPPSDIGSPGRRQAGTLASWAPPVYHRPLPPCALALSLYGWDGPLSTPVSIWLSKLARLLPGGFRTALAWHYRERPRRSVTAGNRAGVPLASACLRPAPGRAASRVPDCRPNPLDLLSTPGKVSTESWHAGVNVAGVRDAPPTQ